MATHRRIKSLYLYTNIFNRPFLSQVSTENKDYLKVQQKLFQGISADELYEQAVASCAEDSSVYKGKR